jgi:hypothetical protein
MLILEPINNTKLDYMIDSAYEKGVTEYARLYIPNQGIDKDGNMLHYFPYGSIFVNNNIVIDEENVFLINGYLNKPGVIVEKYYIKKDMLCLEEKYFRILDSNIDGVNQNDIIIVTANTAERFNIDKKEYFYVRPANILLIMSPSGFLPGPANMLLKLPDIDILGIDTDRLQNKGIHDNITYYFSDALYNININNTEYVIVAKKDIKLYL